MDALRQAVAERLLANIDLAAGHDVTNERRDSRGRWADTLGAAKVAELNAVGKNALGAPESPSPVKYRDFRLEQIAAQAAADKEYRKVTKAGLYEDPDLLLTMKPSPERSWGVYQMDGGYQAINQTLRDERPEPEATMMAFRLNTTRQQLAQDMTAAFDKMGYTTKEPSVLYRVVDGEHVPLESLKPGVIYQDTGVMSCAADPMEVAGLLDPPDQNNVVDMRRENPILLKINMPAGTRVLGGSPGGIETMLPPGSKFRVVKTTPQKKIGGHGRKGHAGYIGRHTLPQVTLELL